MRENANAARAFQIDFLLFHHIVDTRVDDVFLVIILIFVVVSSVFSHSATNPPFSAVRVLPTAERIEQAEVGDGPRGLLIPAEDAVEVENVAERYFADGRTTQLPLENNL